MENKVIHGIESLKELKKGVDNIANAVKETLGPGGNNAIISRPGMLDIVTKDGVTVAKAYPADFTPEGIGVNLIKQVANDTDMVANDGTTTSTVLAQAIMDKAFNKMKPSLYKKIFRGQNLNRIEMKQGMMKATEDVVKLLEELRYSNITESILENIATVSVNGDKSISVPLTKAFNKVGRSQGTITLTFGNTTTTKFEYSNGFRFESPYMFQQFINVQSEGVYKLDESIVLTINDDLDSAPQLIKMVEKYIKEILQVTDSVEIPKLCILVVARSFHDNAIRDILHTMQVNPTVHIMPIRAHSVGEDRTEVIKDFAAIAGSKVIQRSDYANFDVSWYGKAKMAVQDGNKTVVEFDERHFKFPLVKQKIEDMKELIKDENLSKADLELIKNRLSNMQRGLCTVYVGGSTLVEISEKLDRYRDALGSLTSADKQGILPGGGVSLLRVANTLKSTNNRYEGLTYSQKVGYKIIEESLQVPIEQILSNVGKTKSEVRKIKSEIEKSGFTKVFDARNDDFVTTDEYQIVDPCRVTTSAIKMATSVVSTFLSNKVTILNVSTFEDTRTRDNNRI